MKNFLFLALCAAALFSCEKTIRLDLEQTQEAIIIEGLATDVPGKSYIRITKSVPFYQDGPAPAVSNAVATIEDDKGQAFSFVEQEAGYYRPEGAFTGQVGRTYTLTVKAEGQQFTASEKMNYVPPFDSLSYRIDLKEMADPEDEGRFYEILVYIKEPQETTDFYLAKFYRNDTLENWDGTWAFAYDDVLLSEEINSLPAPFYYANSDEARVEMYSITREAYRYYIDLNNNINNDGGMFGGQPANLRTNIEGGAIGYFQVSSVVDARITITD